MHNKKHCVTLYCKRIKQKLPRLFFFFTFREIKKNTNVYKFFVRCWHEPHKSLASEIGQSIKFLNITRASELQA